MLVRAVLDGAALSRPLGHAGACATVTVCRHGFASDHDDGLAHCGSIGVASSSGSSLLICTGHGGHQQAADARVICAMLAMFSCSSICAGFWPTGGGHRCVRMSGRCMASVLELKYRLILETFPLKLSTVLRLQAASGSGRSGCKRSREAPIA